MSDVVEAMIEFERETARRWVKKMGTYAEKTAPVAGLKPYEPPVAYTLPDVEEDEGDRADEAGKLVLRSLRRHFADWDWRHAWIAKRHVHAWVGVKGEVNVILNGVGSRPTQLEAALRIRDTELTRSPPATEARLFESARLAVDWVITAAGVAVMHHDALRRALVHGGDDDE